MDETPGTPLWPQFETVAAIDPGALAVICGDDQATWAELHSRALGLAHDLRDLGVSQGDYLSIVLPNGSAAVVAALAAWALGAVPQPLSPKMSPRELSEIIALTGPGAVIGTDVPGTPSLAADHRTSREDPPPLPAAVSPSWKAPTSGGSSGRPKVIVAGQPGIFEQINGFAQIFQLTGPVLVTAPMSHNGPFMVSMLSILNGQTIVLMPRFDAHEALELIQRHGVGWVYAVPTMMSRIWKLEDRESFGVSTIMVWMHMAAPCSPQLKRDFIGWLGADVVREVYAGTEAQAITLITGTEWLLHPGSVGRALVGEIEARDAVGQPVPAGTTGKLWLRPPAGVRSYTYLGAEADAQPDGWESLGDVGWFDEDGFLHLADRESDMLLVGGSNVYPAEIEGALLEHPDVDDACVIGLPDEDRGSVPHAIVRLTPGRERPDLEAWCRAHLAPYKVPRSFELTEEVLRDAAGKVRRSQLRAARVPAPTA